MHCTCRAALEDWGGPESPIPQPSRGYAAFWINLVHQLLVDLLHMRRYTNTTQTKNLIHKSMTHGLRWITIAIQRKYLWTSYSVQDLQIVSQGWYMVDWTCHHVCLCCEVRGMQLQVVCGESCLSLSVVLQIGDPDQIPLLPWSWKYSLMSGLFNIQAGK